MIEKCFYKICFTPFAIDAPKFFGFSEFLAGLALIILAWTIADVRYRFRIQIAPIPLQKLTFTVVVSTGLLTLITDLWRASGWLVIDGIFITSAIWQAFLGGIFFLTFIIWIWFAFINPPIFGKLNSKRYTQTIYRYIVEGVPSSLAIVADELTYSASKIIKYAPDKEKLNEVEKIDKNLSTVEASASDLLLLIADKRFCRVIAELSPITALALFQAIAEQEKYNIQIGTFAKNLICEALNYQDSFIYQETDGYETGLIGHMKPLTQAIFANYDMVENIETMLDAPLWKTQKWEAAQWEAYCRVVLMTIDSFLKRKHLHHSFTIYRALRCVEHSIDDLYKLDGQTSSFDSDISKQLRVVVDFIKKFEELLSQRGVPKYINLRTIDKERIYNFSYYDHLATLLFNIICKASSVKSPISTCWSIQYSTVWSSFFGFSELDTPAGKIIRFKVRRLIYNEIKEMKKLPNFKGAALLGFCLNVLGLSLDNKINNDKNSVALHKALIKWTVKNFAWLYEYNSRIAEHCLVDGLTYEPDKFRIVKTYPIQGLKRETTYIYLEVDPPKST